MDSDEEDNPTTFNQIPSAYARLKEVVRVCLFALPLSFIQE